MTVQIALDDKSVVSLLRTLIRETERAEAEANTLASLVEQLHDKAERAEEHAADEALDVVHDRLENLTLENNTLSNLVSDIEMQRRVEVDYFEERALNLVIENDALLEINEDLAEKITMLTEELDLAEEELERVASFASTYHPHVPYDIPNESVLGDFHEEDEEFLVDEEYSDYSRYDLDEMTPAQHLASIIS